MSASSVGYKPFDAKKRILQNTNRRIQRQLNYLKNMNLRILKREGKIINKVEMKMDKSMDKMNMKMEKTMMKMDKKMNSLEEKKMKMMDRWNIHSSSSSSAK